MDLRAMQFAHDLKMPIQLIYSCVQLLELEVAPNARAEGYLKLLERSADQLQCMVRSALDDGNFRGSLPRAGAGSSGESGLDAGLALRLSVCDVVAEVRDVSRQCELFAREQGVAVAFRSNAAEFPMTVDVEKLNRILYNLLSNALRFTRPGGRVEVAVELRGDAVEFIVADDGCGIPPERQSRIFELGETDGGLGYGLAIVREYAALLGGDVRVDSAPGKGSRFTVHLPVHGTQERFA